MRVQGVSAIAGWALGYRRRCDGWRDVFGCLVGLLLQFVAVVVSTLAAVAVLLLLLLSLLLSCCPVVLLSCYVCQGKLRVTIQGETIEQQFGEREVCFR